MHVTRAFQPLTIHVSTQREAEILETALETLLNEVERKQGHRWFGFKDIPLTSEQMEYRSQVRKVLEGLNPQWIKRPLFRLPWQ